MTTSSASTAAPSGARVRATDDAVAPAPRRSFRPAEIHRMSELPERQLWIARGVLVALAVLPMLSAVIVLAQGWRPSGDNALIGLRVHDVLTGHFPLIGQPTTGENFGSGIETSHPGPIEFYLVAPFVAVLGPIVGLAVGAAAINAAAFVGTGWLAFRRGGFGLMGVAVLATIAMSRSLGGNILHDPVSSNVGSFVAFTLLFACWSIIAGDLRVTPVFVLCGTFALQDHLSYLGTGSPVVLVSIVIGIWWLVRIRRRAADTSWVRPMAIASGVVAFVLWLPVIVDEIWGDHNINAIIQTFTGKRTAGEGAAFALERLAVALAPMPAFSRRFGPLGYLHTPNTVELVLGYAVLVAIIALGVVFYRRRDTARAAMALVTVLAAIAGTYTAVKLPVGAGIQASNLRWMWTVSAFAWTTLAWMVWALLPRFWRDVLRQPGLAAAALALLLVVAGTLRTVNLSTDRDGDMADETGQLIDRVKQELPEGTYRVTYAGGSVVVSVGPALVHDLDYRGDTILMDIGPFTRAYADHRGFDGQEVDGTIVVSAEANAAYPEGTKLLARQEMRVNRKDADVNTIRVYLVDDDGKQQP